MVENVDLDHVLISINDKLRPLKPLSAECCIYRVPHNLRKVNEDAYRPYVVSIGPFHHGDPKLEPMQEHKLRYWQSFLTRNRENDPSCYVQLVRDKQQAIRDCYNQQIKLDDDTFVEMILLDAAFIIELFMRFGEEDVTDHNQKNFKNLVFRDIRLEENQLPFFILNDLYSLAFPLYVVQGVPLIKFASCFFGKKDAMSSAIVAKGEVKHFVDILRQSYLWSILEEKSDSRDDDSNNKKTSEITFPPSVTELHEAGVRFKKSTTDNLLDISFKNGVLVIPTLKLTDNIETLFRNIMVFEQFHHCRNRYICNYLSFLDKLINTSKDVEMLVEKGIIDNWLGSNEEAAKLINNMCTHIITSDFYYSGVCQELKKYKSRRWPKYRALLKHNYFNHPWAIISVVYAIVLLILTVMQVITGFTN